MMKAAVGCMSLLNTNVAKLQGPASFTVCDCLLNIPGYAAALWPSQEREMMRPT